MSPSSFAHTGLPLLYGVLTFIASLSGCQENFPPYDDPRDILQGDSREEYVLSATDNSLNVYLIVTNNYDESLQAKAVLTGELKIALQRNPLVKKTVQLAPSNLIQGRNYVPQTGEIILDPGDSLRLFFKWNWVDDQGVDLRTQTFEYLEDTTCDDPFVNRCLAKEEVFVISGEVKVFERVATVRFPPSSFNVRFVSRWVNPKYCPPVLPSLPPSYGTNFCTPNFVPIL